MNLNKLLTVYCDFDGTITQSDTIDTLLAALANPIWMEIEAEWERGEIGSLECLARQIPLIKGGWKAVEAQIKKIKLDPTFKDFTNWCLNKNIPIVIVSEGLDKIIKYLLQRDGIIVDAIWANHLIESPTGELNISFPQPKAYNDCRSGLCKCTTLDMSYPQSIKLIIGDGLSDLCWSKHADLFFAKSKLLNYCKINNVSCNSFENFKDIQSKLEKLLEENILKVTDSSIEKT